jgi:hypothetical protein
MRLVLGCSASPVELPKPWTPSPLRDYVSIWLAYRL